MSDINGYLPGAPCEDVYSGLLTIYDQFFEQSNEIAKLKFINQKLSSDLEIQAKVNNLIYRALYGIHQAVESVPDRRILDAELAHLKETLEKL